MSDRLAPREIDPTRRIPQCPDSDQLPEHTIARIEEPVT
jgi:hypothetical protein